MTHRTLLCLALAACLAAVVAGADRPRVLERAAKETLTAVELDRGDVLRFTLRTGQTRTLVVDETSARIVLTNVPTLKKGFHGGGTVYAFTCRVRIDGHPMILRRYVPVQQSFYEPYVVNGMRIWFDGLRQIGELFNENHGRCVPRRAARFAVQDATLPVCPQELRPWFPNGSNALDVRDSYNGDDVWMGPYFGADLHGGLDVNMPIGTPLWAPIDFDDQFFFNSLAMGHNNNRWRGLRRWPNGDLWTLQCHHILNLLVPEHAPLAQGTHYAVAAGVLTGSHAHSHFVFKVGEEGDEILLDPWILFWQTFENNRRRAGALRAEMDPLEPAATGRPAPFRSRSTPGVTGAGLSHYWCFGDGAWATGAEVAHTYTRPGIYPVTLVVEDGVARAATTAHVTVDGEPVDGPALVLAAPDEVTFRPRPASATDVYGRPIRFVPHTLEFVARPRSRPKPRAKRVELRNTGTGTLAEAKITIAYQENLGWLSVTRDGTGNGQSLRLAVDAGGLRPKAGLYHALVAVECPGAANSPQSFRLELTTPAEKPGTTVIVDDADPGCYATPGYWLAPRLHGWPEGHRGGYLIDAGETGEGQFVRFTPDLAAGRYEVSLAPETPPSPSPLVEEPIRFRVRVRHRDGVATLEAEPAASRILGTFPFDEGTNGYVEIHAAAAQGPVVADAVRFRRVAE